MMKNLILGTTNPAKVGQIRAALAPLGIIVTGLPEGARGVVVIEDGTTAEENARKKARAYTQTLGEPVLSMDNALFFEGLRAEEQPGIHARRFAGSSERPSDEEVLAHYSRLVTGLGGRVNGHWDFALCYADRDGGLYERTIASPRIFVGTPCSKLVPGYPLESIQIDPVTGKYIAEMSEDEQDVFWQRVIGDELAVFIRSIKE